MIRIAIADDEAKDAELTRAFTDRFFTEAGTEHDVTVFSDGRELLERPEESFDLILLDVEMNDVNGIDLAAKIREKDSQTVIIFISRIAGYAVKGYSVGAMDYLLKPVRYPEFALKVRKALHYIKTHKAGRIQINMDGDYRWISGDELRYVEIFGHELLYHTNAEDLRTTGSISAVLKQLEPLHFVQVSRFCIVNLRYVTGIDGNDLLLGENRITISRRRRKDVVDALLRYHGGMA